MLQRGRGLVVAARRDRREVEVELLAEELDGALAFGRVHATRDEIDVGLLGARNARLDGSCGEAGGHAEKQVDVLARLVVALLQLQVLAQVVEQRRERGLERCGLELGEDRPVGHVPGLEHGVDADEHRLVLAEETRVSHMETGGRLLGDDEPALGQHRGLVGRQRALGALGDVGRDAEARGRRATGKKQRARRKNEAERREARHPQPVSPNETKHATKKDVDEGVGISRIRPLESGRVAQW